MRIKPTVTIGIPAYNEEANIANLLNSILSQRGDFIIEKIIVANDASTDKTAVIVKNFAKKYKSITLFNNKKRQGKLANLNYIYEKSKSDVLVTFDADLTLDNIFVVRNLINKLSENFVLVGGNFRPRTAGTFVGRLCQVWDDLWFNVRSNYKDGDNIYNSSGAAFAIKKEFLKTFRYPKSAVADQQNIYLTVKKINKKFYFAKDAVIYYKTPDTLRDHIKQSLRWLNDRKSVEPLYPNLLNEFYIPFSIKIRAIFKSFIKSPLFTVLVLGFQVYLRLLPTNYGKSKNNAIWDIVVSTKSNSDPLKLDDDKLAFRLKRILMEIIYRFGFYVGINTNTVSVLCYHNISDKEDRYTVTPEMLRKEIERIRLYADFIGLDEAVDIARFGKSVNRPKVVLTFDDGYKGVLNALPVTKKYKIPVTLFVLSNPKSANRKEMDNYSELLSQKEIKTLHQKEGWKVACHSATHPNLTKLSKQKLLNEVVYSKYSLEKFLKDKIDYFAYPKGKYNDNIVHLIKGAGYKAAFTIEAGSLTWVVNRWLLPRTIIDKTHNLSEFPAVFSPTSFLIRKITNKLHIWDKFLNYA